MILMYTFVGDTIVNKKFYKNSTQQTREHYISTLKTHFRGNYKMLDLVNEYKRDFIVKAAYPWDDNFSFFIENIVLDGIMLNNNFYSYNLDVNAKISLTLLFPHNDFESRKIFIEEIKYYLKSNGYYNAYEQLQGHINAFQNEDNQYIYVEKHNLAMKNEDDY